MRPRILLNVIVLSAVLLQQSVRLATEFNEGQKSLSFSKVEGRVDHIWRNSKQDAFRHRRVVYTYAVNGKKYVSERETYPDRPNCSVAYSDGDTVDVYFDPADPAECCLKTGIDDGETMWQGGILVGLLVLSLSIAVFFKEKPVIQ